MFAITIITTTTTTTMMMVHSKPEGRAKKMKCEEKMDEDKNNPKGKGRPGERGVRGMLPRGPVS